MKTFIPLTTDIFNDNRISALMNKFGPAGYGVYLILIGEMRNHKDYCITSESLKVIIRTHRIRRKLLEEVLHNFKLFNIEKLSNDNIIVSSDYVSEVMKAYDEKIEQSRIYGRLGAEKRWGEKATDVDSPPTTKEKKRKEEKRTSEEKEKEDAAEVETDVPLSAPKWKQHLADAVNDRQWIELIAISSGLGARFLQYLPMVVDIFSNHIVANGKHTELYTVQAAKCYFANFMRRGSPTNRRIIQALDDLEAFGANLESPGINLN